MKFGEKVADVSYTIHPETPYFIRSIEYEIPDSILADFFYESINKTLVEEGDIYNAFVLDDERDRITKVLAK